MNHDYTHCLDYDETCPKTCFRAELAEELEKRKEEFVGIPLSFSHLKGTAGCEKSGTMTITLTENSSRELFKMLEKQDEIFINDVLCGRCGFTLKSSDGRSVELVPREERVSDADEKM